MDSFKKCKRFVAHTCWLCLLVWQHVVGAQQKGDAGLDSVSNQRLMTKVQRQS